MENINLLLAQHQSFLYSSALKLTRNADDAEDLCQETSIRILQNANKFEEGTNFKGWASIILRNAFINEYRKRQTVKHQPTVSLEKGALFIGVDYNIDAQLDNEFVQKMLNGLKESLRKPFLMFFEGYSYEEIAEEMKLPLGTVKSRLFFARKIMKEALAKHGLVVMTAA